jgi:hypothetical protein
MYFSTKNYLKNNYYHIVKHTTDKHPMLLIYSINYIYCPKDFAHLLVRNYTSQVLVWEYIHFLSKLKYNILKKHKKNRKMKC